MTDVPPGGALGGALGGTLGGALGEDGPLPTGWNASNGPRAADWAAGRRPCEPPGSRWRNDRSASEYSGNSSRSWPMMATANHAAKPVHCPAMITARTA